MLDELGRVGINAISTTPQVATPARPGRGKRFPPLHVDGHARVVARPLWGRHELDLELFDAYTPDLDLYRGSTYGPRSAELPEGVDGEAFSRLVSETKRRGIELHLQVQPLLPPGLSDEDRPVYIDGTRPGPPMVADHSCVNSPAAQAYGLALVEDVVTRFEPDGLFMDWVEFGAYRMRDNFTCFCAHCEAQSARFGLDADTMRRDVSRLWERLHALTSADLRLARSTFRDPAALADMLVRYPGVASLLELKARSVLAFYRDVRRLLDGLGRGSTQLAARGWPPPWSRSSGMDYGALADVCHSVTPKLFTFDYSALPTWYGQQLVAWNPHLTEGEVLDALVECMHLDDDIAPRTFDRYRIPGPEELHPARLEVYRDRIDDVAGRIEGRARCYPFAHAYLPDAQWETMVSLVRKSRADGMWVQMYAYLSDSKVEILRRGWQEAVRA